MKRVASLVTGLFAATGLIAARGNSPAFADDATIIKLPPITADILSPAPTVITSSLQGGDEVHIVAEFDTTDDDDDNEGEPLVISSNHGPTFRMTTHKTSQAFSFTATGNGEILSAYIQSGDFDESAHITVTIERQLAVSSLSISPGLVCGGGGGSATGTVTLNGPAPSGGALVALDSVATAATGAEVRSNSTAGYPAAQSVTVPEGSTSAKFTIWTNAVPTAWADHHWPGQVLTIRASYGGSRAEATLGVFPRLDDPLDAEKSDIKGWEKTSPQVYLDSKKIPTIGIGHKVGLQGTAAENEFKTQLKNWGYNAQQIENVLRHGQPITDPEIQELFNKDFTDKVGEAKKAVGATTFDNLPVEAQRILTNMDFSLGESGLSDFHKLMAALNQSPPDYFTASDEILNSDYARDVSRGGPGEIGRAVEMSVRMQMLGVSPCPSRP
jgi:hypothetical protein